MEVLSTGVAGNYNGALQVVNTVTNTHMYMWKTRQAKVEVLNYIQSQKDEYM